MDLVKMNVVHMSKGKAVIGVIDVSELPKNYRIVNYNGIPADKVFVSKAELDKVVFDKSESVKLFSFKEESFLKDTWNMALKKRSEEVLEEAMAKAEELEEALL